MNPNVIRLALFAAVCLGASLIAQIAMIWLAQEPGPIKTFLDSAREGALYGIPIALCGITGLILRAWRRGSVWANFFASILCFVMPVVAGTLVLVVYCFVLNLCFCFSGKCY